MPTDTECERYARDCARLAGLTHDQYIRDKLLDMAHEWMAEAMKERPWPLKREKRDSARQ